MVCLFVFATQLEYFSHFFLASGQIFLFLHIKNSADKQKDTISLHQLWNEGFLLMADQRISLGPSHTNGRQYALPQPAP